QVEVASLIGDVALSPEGKPALHIHVVLGRRNGSALAGHLAEAHVRPTLEVILTESPAYLTKAHDPESGLALTKPSSPLPRFFSGYSRSVFLESASSRTAMPARTRRFRPCSKNAANSADFSRTRRAGPFPSSLAPFEI